MSGPSPRRWRPRRHSPARRREAGLVYRRHFVSPPDREEIVRWLSTIHPLWEMRYPESGSQPPRRLLRPVYWLGAWQFACLDYYRPPKGVEDRCVQAEPFPPVLSRLIGEVERIARGVFAEEDRPRGWTLNTCLVNLYGSRLEEGRKVDVARVGEHRDFEPGPVASISLGERALFQFVKSRRPGTIDAVVRQQWLDDGSLLLFGGEPWKRALFHRVQRVDRRAGERFPLAVEDFLTRRVNFTFRYVPPEHIVEFARLSRVPRENVRGYLSTLARHSPFFARQVAAETDSERFVTRPEKPPQ